MPRRIHDGIRLRAACLLAVLAALAVHARAQATAIDVPEGCGSERELRVRLERLLGEAPDSTALPERLQIRPLADGGYELSLRVRGEARVLRDPDCRTLFQTAVVVTAAAIDPHARLEQAQLEDASESPADDAPQSAAAPASGPRIVWRAGAAVGLGVAFGLVPEPAPWVELSGSLAHGAVGFELAARYLTPAEERRADDYGVRMQGVGGRFGAFFDPWSFARLQVAAALDHLDGHGLGGAVRAGSGSGVAMTLGVEALAAPIALGQLRLWLGASGHYALVRPSFEITGYGEVYRVQRLGGGGVARLGWTFR